MLEVVSVAFATAMLAYPNEYTRMNTSELIYLLFSQCGITNQEGICDYVNRNFTNANDAVSIAEAGPGVYQAMWKLSLALVFKLVVTVFTFGIKGNVVVIVMYCTSKNIHYTEHSTFTSLVNV